MENITKLPEKWIEYQRAFNLFGLESEKAKALKAHDRELDHLVHKKPLEAWEVILEILRINPEEEVLDLLAAGPLENLLSYNGEKVIELVKDRAKLDDNFKNLLGGVWQGGMSNEIWQIVQEILEED